MSKLNHPNIIEFFDYGFDGEMTYTEIGKTLACQHFISMEYFEGMELYNFV